MALTIPATTSVHMMDWDNILQSINLHTFVSENESVLIAFWGYTNNKTDKETNK